MKWSSVTKICKQYSQTNGCCLADNPGGTNDFLVQSLYIILDQFRVVEIIGSGENDEKHKVAQNEVEMLAKLDLKYVVRYYNSWIENKCMYVQMENCQQTLWSVLKDKSHVFSRQEKKPMNLYKYFISCEIFREILQCLQYLHSLNPPIIHRDIKPDNILILNNSNDGRFLKLGDLALATYHEPTMTHTQGVGTSQFMAQEVFSSNKYDTKSDIFSLGCIGYILFDISEIKNQKYNSTIFMDKVNALHYILKSMVEDRSEDRPTSESNLVNRKKLEFLKNLRDVLEVKNTLFNRRPAQPFNIYEFFMSCEIFRELLQCLQYLHGLYPPIIHRDIKPANILILQNTCNNTFIKLGDFGLATEHNRALMSHTRGAGTPNYTAYEVGLNGTYDFKADIFSLGMIGFQMFEINTM
ncbi:unnamed protein product [Medioppia subpectinata]|uniref:Protein kinase domain-containing protein n=1 Tax=Medioppia subpectinata TaxID=1979941 RepID=A0A7R9KAV6_9ACAR|nr:unnamed protein product [Medioppia subpectinata]CAG2100073.1 unnamed protein product [Medioppia subpectinata]